MGPDPDVILGRLALGRKYVTSEQVRGAMASRTGDQSLDEILVGEGLIDEDQRTELIHARDAFLERQGGGEDSDPSTDPDATMLSAGEARTPDEDPQATIAEPGSADPNVTGPTLVSGEGGGQLVIDDGTQVSDPDHTPGTLDAEGLTDGITIDEFVPETGADQGQTFSDEPDDGGVGQLENQVIGGCKIGRKLGQGGMGAVYEAVHVALSKKVAIKVIATGAAPSNALVQRFQREARAAARLAHPNIVGVFDVGHDKGFHFIQMEFIEGQSVRDAIGAESLDLEECVRILRESLKGLQAAHDQDLVHRDIKPDNILVSTRGEVKIADFGLARSVQEESLEITRSGQILGTPHFMSPEQCDGQKTDGRTDIYSLGVTMYTMLAGEKPFVGDTAMAILMKHINEEPPPLVDRRPDVPEDLANVVGKMMAKDLQDRYPSAQAVLDDLDLWDRGGKIAAPKRRRRRRSGGGVLVALLVLVLVAGGGAFAAVQGWIPGLELNKAPATAPTPGTAPRRETALDKAQKHLNVNEFAEAIPYLEQWTKSHPNDAKAHALLENAQFKDALKAGRDQLFNKRWDGAIETLTRAVAFARSDSLRSEAQTELDQATAKRDAEARRAGVATAMEAARQHMRNGKWDEALAAIERVLAVDSDDPMAKMIKRNAARNARAAAALADATQKLDRADTLLSQQEDETGALPVLDSVDTLLAGVEADVRDEDRLQQERTQLGERATRLRDLAGFLTVRKSAEALERSQRWIDAAAAYDRAAAAAGDSGTADAMRSKATACRHAQADVLIVQGDTALTGNDVAAALAAFRAALELRPDAELAARTRTLAQREATPEGMLYIPAGPFAAGSAHSRDNNPEQPIAELASYYIGQAEVTNAEYARFVRAGGYADEAFWDADGWAAVATFVDRSGKPGPATWADGDPPSGRERHPVIGVCWFEARAYARWSQGRLPTEIEWERAAAYDAGTAKKRDYPWGDDWREGFAALEGAFDATHPVGTHPRDRSPAGLLDVCGNAHEWTSGTVDRNGQLHAVARGGGVGAPSPEAHGRLLRRRVIPVRTYRAGALGFRLVRDPVQDGDGGGK